ncbi:unnamed protein product, partial [Brassica rapa]
MVRSNPNFNGSRTTTPSTQQQDTGSGNSGDAGRIYVIKLTDRVVRFVRWFIFTLYL